MTNTTIKYEINEIVYTVSIHRDKYLAAIRVPYYALDYDMQDQDIDDEFYFIHLSEQTLAENQTDEELASLIMDNYCAGKYEI